MRQRLTRGRNSRGRGFLFHGERGFGFDRLTGDTVVYFDPEFVDAGSSSFAEKVFCRVIWSAMFPISAVDCWECRTDLLVDWLTTSHSTVAEGR